MGSASAYNAAMNDNPAFLARNTVYYLQQLQVLRALVWLAQTLTVLLAHRWLSDPQLYMLLGLSVVQLLVIAASHGLLLKFYDIATEPGEREFFAQLLVDCLVLSGILYVAGGATNPFVSYYLVPIALAAATLSRAYTILLAACCLVAYSLLLKYYLPLHALSPADMSSHEHHHQTSGISLHVLGMWLNFGISALLITHFVATIASTVRRQREDINRLREQQLMDENILAVATLAAGTAHELGTPLSSLSVLLGDMQQDHRDNPVLAGDLQLMADQLQRCQQSLRQLADTAREHQDGSDRRLPVAKLVERLMRDWQVLRPEVQAEFTVVAGPDLDALLPLTVEQAIINVLNNAADAGESLKVGVRWDRHELVIEIEDDGPGIGQQVLEQRRRIKMSEKGMGLGLLLSHASLERAGGTLSLQARADGGTLTRIAVPIGGAG
ncbi:MAG TPA: ATP-binding protein [Pseudomonadales bacterium]|nr:ATP-binding protein [Pseudomonadales bacterium]